MKHDVTLIMSRRRPKVVDFNVTPACVTKELGVDLGTSVKIDRSDRGRYRCGQPQIQTEACPEIDAEAI